MHSNLSNNKRSKVTILGAGLAGLSAGWVLQKKGYDVTIIERDSVAGGLSITKSADGYSWDLGPHNIHTNYDHILKFLQRTFSGLYEHFAFCMIFKRGKFINYPLKGIRVITTLPPVRLVAAVCSFFCARLMMFLRTPSRDGNFKEWIRNRFGSVLYKEYFHDYPKKVWGIEPDKIDRYVAEKRIPIISLTELVRTAILGRVLKSKHPELARHNYYLPKGIGALPGFFEREFVGAGGRLVLDSTPNKVTVVGERVASVSFSSGGTSEDITTDYLLSTIPVPALVGLFQESPARVVECSNRLDYVASVLLFIKTKIENPLPAPLLYFSQPHVRFTRVSDVGAFSRAMVPAGCNLICLEFPCSEGDELWNESLENLTSHAISIFEESQLFAHEAVIGSFQEKISHSYPRFRDGFLANLSECQGYLHGFKNCLSYGRQGGFAYINTDGAMHQGFQAAESILMAEAVGFSISEWFSVGNRNH